MDFQEHLSQVQEHTSVSGAKWLQRGKKTRVVLLAVVTHSSILEPKVGIF